MTNYTKFSLQFSNVKNKKVVGNFKGGEVTSDGGILLLSKIDKRINLTKSIAKYFVDNRRSSHIVHSIQNMLKQRIYALAAGYEDLNDHDLLKKDSAFKTAVGKEINLASSPTLCRFENSMTRSTGVHIHQELLRIFVESFSQPPEKVILDFDATDIPIHGNQEGKAFHGYYNHDCFLPLHVFCGDHLLVSYLRKSNEDAAKHAWAILALLVKYLKSKWPKVKIIFRGDGGFCRQNMLNWCDRNEVGYIVGLACNSRLQKALHPYLERAKITYQETKQKQQIFAQFAYRAYSWKYPRKVIGKAEVTSKRVNTRTIVTNLKGTPEELYKKQYCSRGNMENYIKEQLLLFSDRTSCHKWWPNQLRLLLSSLAYVLMEHLRSSFLKGTEFAQSQVNTIRLKLFKIGAVIIKHTKKIMFFFSSHYPYQDLFIRLVAFMNTS